jgi:hypothetical protein
VPSDEEFAAARGRAAELLAQLPGVHAIGVGSKEVGGAMTGEPAIKVFVIRKLPVEEIPEAERIPGTIGGIRTDVVETGQVHLTAAPPPGANRPADSDEGDDGRHRSLIGGSQISMDGSEHVGTMGCFVWNTANQAQVWGLTCYHVVSPPDIAAPVAGTTDVGQPDTGSSCGCCKGKFGKYAGGNRVGPPNGSPDRDEAVLRVSAGMKWRADIMGIGTNGADGPVAGTHQVTTNEANSGTYPVRKRGKRTRLTGGIVSTLVSGPTITDNVLVVNPNPAPSPGTSFFDWHGDSGSVLINDAGQVVGLVYSTDDAGHGYALMIGGVLSRLSADLGAGVTLDVATAAVAGIDHTVSGAAMAAVPHEVVSALAGEQASADRTPVLAAVGQWALPEPPPTSFGHVEEDLVRSPSGRRLAAMWQEHEAELIRLVNTNRRLTAVWHRSGAAAIFQLLLRMTIDPAVRMPETVNGQPLAACVERVHALLARTASPRLRTELDWVRSWLPAIAGLTYPQILQTLDRT